MLAHCRLLPTLAALLLLAGLAPPSGAQTGGTLRERWREHLIESRAQRPAAESDPGAHITAAGDYRYSIKSGGLQRQYLVHVPHSVDPAVKAPLLMAFHGGGGNMQFQADDSRYGLISLSERAGFIAVFPNGYSTLPGDRLATWNAGNCCAAARDKNIDDVGFVRALLGRLQQQIAVDPRRIYATGMSNGAMMAQRLACEMSDVFSAIAAVAGTDNTQHCAPLRPISILEIHARDDDHVLFNGGAGAGAFPDESKVTDFRSVPETIARWTQRDGCTTPPRRVLDRPGAYCERYSGCRDGVQVQLCVTETGGHSWPGAGRAREGKAPASQAISANEVMWDFFSR